MKSAREIGGRKSLVQASPHVEKAKNVLAERSKRGIYDDEEGTNRRDLPDDEFLKDISECNMACVGDSSLKCGGPNRMNVYHTSTFSDGDCYEDNKNGFRLFENTHTFNNPYKSNSNMPAMYN